VLLGALFWSRTLLWTRATGVRSGQDTVAVGNWHRSRRVSLTSPIKATQPPEHTLVPSAVKSVDCISSRLNKMGCLDTESLSRPPPQDTKERLSKERSMILAEAPNRPVKNRRTRLDDLKTRLQSALVQEGEPPPEGPRRCQAAGIRPAAGLLRPAGWAGIHLDQPLSLPPPWMAAASPRRWRPGTLWTKRAGDPCAHWPTRRARSTSATVCSELRYTATVSVRPSCVRTWTRVRTGAPPQVGRGYPGHQLAGGASGGEARVLRAT
jgi:hypothetical protein